MTTLRIGNPTPRIIDVALYRFYNTDGTLLYVGITSDPAKRFAKHAGTKTWWRAVARIEIEWHETRGNALAAERDAIKRERPAWNTVHRQ